MEHVRDRGQDVDRGRKGVVDPALLLAWELDEERDEGDVVHVRPGRAAALVVAAEALALVAGDDHERPVVEARRAQLLQDQAEGAVGVAELEQVALLAFERGPLRQPVPLLVAVERALVEGPAPP